MADDKEREIQELRDRLAALEGQPKPPPLNASPTKGSKEQGCAIAVFATLIVVGLVSYCGSQTTNTTSSSLAGMPSEPAWIPPEGYALEAYAGGNRSRMGTKWVTPTANECRGSGKTCFAIEVVTEKPCYRGLYASITLLGKDDTNIGWTNDTAQGVEAGEKVRLVFGTYERGVEAARLAEINCY